MHTAYREFQGMAFLKNAISLGFLFQRGRPFRRVILVHRVNGYKVTVQQFDDLGVRERTRSHRKCAPSTPPNIHSAIVSEKKHWTIQLPGPLPGVPDVFGPADLVKALFSGCRLEFVNALFD